MFNPGKLYKQIIFKVLVRGSGSAQDLINYQKLFEDHTAVNLLIDPYDGSIINANYAASKYYGWTREELMKMKISQINVLSSEKIAVEMEKAKARHRNQFEFKHRLANGNVREVEVFSGVIDFHGKKILNSIIHDITDRKQIEKELRISEEKYRNLFSNSEVGMFRTRLDGSEILEFNDKYLKIIDYTADEVKGKPSRNFWANPDERDTMVQILNTQGIVRDFECQIYDKHGNIKHCITSLVLYKETGILEGSIIDITERKKAEEQLQIERNKALENEERFRSAFYTNPEAITINELITGKCILINGGFTKMLGYSEKEAVGKTSLELGIWVSKEERRKFVQLIEKSNFIENQEIRFVTKCGKLIDCLVSAAIMHSGTNTKIISIFRDISYRKCMERELLKAKELAEENDKLKTAFLQNMSHEIRTPMNAIMGFSELLPTVFDDKEKLERFSMIIDQRCHDLLNIINDILDVSKIESGQMEINWQQCDINLLFADLLNFFEGYQRKLKKEHISFKLATQLLPNASIIKTDILKLKQILINLITNAFKFTCQGQIEVGCKVFNNDMLEFFVSDTGTGIPTDKHQAVFERFTQLNNNETSTMGGGTGLGLPIVKGLVNMLGGTVFLESEPEKGSRFSFTLPYF